jgi:methionine-rich copper-binding protein CopC
MSVRAVVALLVGFVVLASATPGAGAHAELVSSCPGNGEFMSELPTIRFTFDSPLIVSDEEPAAITIERPSGGPIPALGPVELIGVNALVAPVLEPIRDGSYIVKYDVVSADGDANVGEAAFAVEAGGGDATNCVEPDVEGESGGGVGQMLLVVIPLVAVGGALVGFNRWAARRNTEPVA